LFECCCTRGIQEIEKVTSDLNIVFSAKGKRLETDQSQFLVPRIRRLSRPLLPNVPATGAVKAAVLKLIVGAIAYVQSAITDHVRALGTAAGR
jgi:hypothetical protein